jgi:hypothetical protein
MWLTTAALIGIAPTPTLPAYAQPVVNGGGRTEMLDCAGGDAQVNGDANRLVFHGDCRNLRVNGASNIVEIDLTPGGSIVVAGAGNQVLYTPIEPGPSVSEQGVGNVVQAGTHGAASAALAPEVPPAPLPPPTMTPPPPPGAGTLILTGNGVLQEANCAGRNVVIQGSGGRYTLRGGCRSVTVDGSRMAIEAELEPGARIAIGGDAVTLNYVLTAPGTAALVSVSGAGSQATHIEHFGETTATVPAQ